MQSNLQQLMKEATRLTRVGKLQAATAAWEKAATKLTELEKS